jgi:hypothetical protein
VHGSLPTQSSHNLGSGRFLNLGPSKKGLKPLQPISAFLDSNFDNLSEAGIGQIIEGRFQPLNLSFDLSGFLL